MPRRRLVWALVWGACASAILPAPRSAAEDWPRWRGPRGDGTWQGPQLPKAWPAGGPKVVWKKPIGGGYAGVSVAAGRVLTMERPAGGDNERVVCFDAATGDLLWEHVYAAPYGKLDYGSGPRAAPTIDGDFVYTLGAVGHVCCLEAATGRVVWSRDCRAELGAKLPEWGFAASPFVFGELVIVHVAAQPAGCFVALRKVDGQEAWRAGSDPAGYATPILVDRGGEPQLVGWTPENIVGLDPRTGAIDWTVPYKVAYGVSIATPICQEGMVFVTGYWEGSKAIALGAARNEVRLAWEEKRELCGLMSQPLYRDGYVYCLDKAHGLVCSKLATGEKLWVDKHSLTPRGRNPQVSLTWLGDGDRIVALNSDGELVLARLNRAGYDEQSRAAIIGPTWAHPAYAGRHAFARDDQELVCVELAPAPNELPGK